MVEMFTPSEKHGERAELLAKLDALKAERLAVAKAELEAKRSGLVARVEGEAS